MGRAAFDHCVIHRLASAQVGVEQPVTAAAAPNHFRPVCLHRLQQADEPQANRARVHARR